MRDLFVESLDPVAFAESSLEFHPDPRQSELLRTDSKRCIVNCTRQWGKSTVTAVKAVHRAFFYPDSLILAISPSARQSAEFLRKSARFIRKLGIRVKGDGDNDISISLANGSRIVGLPNTEDRIRGFSAVSLLVIDEASRVSDKIYHAVRPMVAVGRSGRGGDLWLMSTPNGKRGFFWDVWSKGGPEWTRITVPATECPRISKDFLAEEQRSNADRFFRQEYMCEFLDTDDGAFSEDWIEAAISGDVPTLQEKDQDGPLEIIEQSRQFFVGLDLGQRQDYTAIAVVERLELAKPGTDPGTRAKRMVTKYRVRQLERLPLGIGYTDVVEKVRSLMQNKLLAGRSSLVVDSSGVGVPVVEMLRKCMGCNIEPVTITAGNRSKTDQWGWKMPRVELMSHLAIMLEQKEVAVSQRVNAVMELRDELRNMRVRYGEGGRQKFEADSDAVHDDLVVAIALACWKAKKSSKSIWGTQRLFF
jgi:hypothetical protein